MCWGSVKDQLGRLERRQFESEASIMKQLASAGNLPAASAGTASVSSQSEQGGVKVSRKRRCRGKWVLL